MVTRFPWNGIVLGLALSGGACETNAPVAPPTEPPAMSATVALVAQTVVVGTGDPNLDVPAVQAAVDAGGEVLLVGTFSFDRPPTNGRSILVSRPVHILGTANAAGGTATILGGQRPFEINAPGARVSIERIHFIGWELLAMDVQGVRGLRIANCGIERGVGVNFPGLGVLAGGVLVFPANRARVTEDITIVDNEFDVGGTETVRTYGIIVIGVGVPNDPVEVLIARNQIRNVTAHGVDVRQVIGGAIIERNVVRPGPVGGQRVPQADKFVDGIRVVGLGTYLVRHNTVEVAFENAAGIRLQGNSPQMPLTGATIESNHVTMAVPDGVVPGTESAGIELRRVARDNAIWRNQVRGRASAAFALISDPTNVLDTYLTPADNTFVGNNQSIFGSTLADVFVGPRVSRTTFVGGTGIVDDHGVRTSMDGGYRTLSGAHYHQPPGLSEVEAPVFTALSVSPSSATIFTVPPANAVLLVATPLDQNALPMIGLGSASFESSNPTAASVDASGLVTAIAPGTADVTASLTADGVTKTATAAIEVRVAPATAEVTAPGIQFIPAVADIRAGGTVTWTFESVTHNVTFDDPGAPPSIPTFANGSESRTFPNTGTFNYRCTIHAGMFGIVRAH